MPKYIITYDLNKEGDGYKKAQARVELAIRELASGSNITGQGSAVRRLEPGSDILLGSASESAFRRLSPLTTVWVGETNMSLRQVHDHVSRAVDENDDLLVGEFGEFIVDKGKLA